MRIFFFFCAQYLIEEGLVDGFRGGVFDAIERLPGNGVSLEFAWLNTNFWQQDQGILAFLVAHGHALGAKPEYLENARTMQAFYNAFFLDFDNQVGARTCTIV
jgi:hypothetical protein